MPVTHKFISPKSDTADPTKVQASHWNEPHDMDIFVDDETPAGIKNNSNLIFTIAQEPFPVSSLKVYLNGVRMKLGLGYNFSGTTITFSAGFEPGPLDILSVEYRKE